MAGNEPQKQLLSLIRDFATEKTQGGKVHLMKRYVQKIAGDVPGKFFLISFNQQNLFLVFGFDLHNRMIRRTPNRESEETN